MSLYGVMRTSTSGMAAQANRLSAVADNIANSNTTGYKRASTEFSSLIIDNSPTTYTPGSVQTVVRHSIGEQGSLLATTSVTDIAIKGDGFFVVSDADGTPYLTRAGSFIPDSSGNLINASGFNLLGYPITGDDIDVVANGYSGLEVVNVNSLAMKANPTRNGDFRVNLPSDATAVVDAELPSTNVAGAKYTAKTSLLSYDNLGQEVVLDVYSTKKADGSWEMAVYNKADAAAGGGFPYSSAALSTTTLTFDGTTGQLTPTSSSSLSIPIPNGQTVTLDLTGTSQFATAYTVVDAVLDGNAPVAVDSISISNDGTVFATYENGNRVAAYKIPLANVSSPDNLVQLTGNVFSTATDSGDVQIGFAGAAGLGAIVSSALEQSTVDMATELTAMIDAQRGYTANSKVFQTGAELMDVLVNLKR
ncbi:flagellar hook protein FlgE [soil metagenome]